MDDFNKTGTGKLDKYNSSTSKMADDNASPAYEENYEIGSSELSEGNDEVASSVSKPEDEATVKNDNPASIENREGDDKQEEKQEQSESKSSEHDGKYFVIPRGKAMCNKGTAFPNFKVTSHQKHYWNNAEGQADYLAVTEDDLTFNPPTAPLGSCAVKNGNPCTFAPAGKWQKPYEKVKVLGKSCLTEASELMCSIGGKITVMKHGQQSEAGKSNAIDANSAEQEILNPVVDYDEFKEEIEENDDRHAW